MGMSGARAEQPAKFAGTHRWDRNFFLSMVALIWLGILMGFVPEITQNFHQHKHYPLIVHIHAVAFVGWLCLLLTQVLLIRTRRTDLHRKLGMAGACLYGSMIVLGIAAAVTTARLQFGTPDSDPSFLSIQFADMLSFTVLGGAALAFRKVPSAHKRLILLATIFIANAGFARWWGDGLHDLLGAGLNLTDPYLANLVDGYWVNVIGEYLADFLLVAALGAYDLVTRRRLHPAYIFGATWGLGFELIAIWLYMSPWWRPVAIAIMGR